MGWRERPCSTPTGAATIGAYAIPSSAAAISPSMPRSTSAAAYDGAATTTRAAESAISPEGLVRSTCQRGPSRATHDTRLPSAGGSASASAMRRAKGPKPCALEWEPRNPFGLPRRSAPTSPPSAIEP
jgi:hypothetical protein